MSKSSKWKKKIDEKIMHPQWSANLKCISNYSFSVWRTNGINTTQLHILFVESFFGFICFSIFLLPLLGVRLSIAVFVLKSRTASNVCMNMKNILTAVCGHESNPNFKIWKLYVIFSVPNNCCKLYTQKWNVSKKK